MPRTCKCGMPAVTMSPSGIPLCKLMATLAGLSDVPVFQNLL